MKSNFLTTIFASNLYKKSRLHKSERNSLLCIHDDFLKNFLLLKKSKVSFYLKRQKYIFIIILENIVKRFVPFFVHIYNFRIGLVVATA